MNYQYKVYTKDEKNKLHTAIITKSYDEACKKEKELNDQGFDTILWQC